MKKFWEGYSETYFGGGEFKYVYLGKEKGTHFWKDSAGNIVFNRSGSLNDRVYVAKAWPIKVPAKIKQRAARV